MLDSIRGVDAMMEALATALAEHAPHAMRIAVALSGGRDSMALLDVAALWSTKRGTLLSAIHVHHGLSPNADDWAQFCAKACAERDIAFTVRRVHVETCARASLEATARRMRYAALRDAAIEAGIDVVLLAHHQDDQAETLLLQLARGAGPHGLASMPVARRDGPIVWLRPMLGVTRAAIEAYARARAFEWVDDESNVNTRFRRNAWRHRIIPLIASVASGYPATVARAAEHQADAAHLLDELALLDAGTGYDGSSLTRSTLQALSRSRAGNLL